MEIEEGENTFTIAFSGDTRPNFSFVSAILNRNSGNDVDLLIHEATFLDDKKQDAFDKGHSTLSQASMAAEQAGMQGRVIYTHFSQRYNRRSMEKEVSGKLLAIDGLRISMTKKGIQLANANLPTILGEISLQQQEL